MSFAQVGYQVSLLDSSTGEPRVNENVSVTVQITDSKGAILCSEQQSVTSDAFGVLSMTIGDEDTFKNVDWRNLPLKISATVDGILLGSCNVLNVPVAEHAKHTGVLTMEWLDGKTVPMGASYITMTFYANGKATFYTETETPPYTTTYQFEIDGNNVYVYYLYPGDGDSETAYVFHYSEKFDKLYLVD